MNYDAKLRHLLLKAHSIRASDIHITKNKSKFKVELRDLQSELIQLDSVMNNNFVQFIKVKAHIDLLSSLKPQTGQFEMMIAQQNLSIRVAYLKNNQTESLVLRILNLNMIRQLKDIFNNIDLNEINYYLQKQSGLILFSGTTGSGKTTSLYACMDALRTKKIYSIEDPIEVIRDHVVQLQVNKQADFGFEEAIKQILRHDPNVIVIGEIRSSEEALAALRCSLSGHLVLSSIHASSCESTLNRLKDFKCDREVINDSLLAVFYQELNYNFKEDKREATFNILKTEQIQQQLYR